MPLLIKMWSTRETSHAGTVQNSNCATVLKSAALVIALCESTWEGPRGIRDETKHDNPSIYHGWILTVRDILGDALIVCAPVHQYPKVDTQPFSINGANDK